MCLSSTEQVRQGLPSTDVERVDYGQFSKFQLFFCGLDPGNLKFETVRTNKQRICF